MCVGPYKPRKSNRKTDTSIEVWFFLLKRFRDDLTAEKLNKNRVNKNLQVNDYVFVKDRTEIVGATRPLKTKLDPSPYVVLSVKFTTVLVQRLSDGFISLYSQDDVKKYDTTSDLFKEIPKETKKIERYGTCGTQPATTTFLFRSMPFRTSFLKCSYKT